MWNGSYSENVDVDKSRLTLEGEGANVVNLPEYMVKYLAPTHYMNAASSDGNLFIGGSLIPGVAWVYEI